MLASCGSIALASSERRALRWGGQFYMPMLVGQQTTPWILEGVVGHALTKDSDPAKAKAFRAAVVTSCDYVLGTNALNQTWVTGLGPRHVKEVFHMDAWYNGKPTLHPGLIASPRAVLLPHIGSATIETRQRMTAAMIEAIERRAAR